MREEELKKCSDERLKNLFIDGYRNYKRWSNSQDGSDGACWDYEVKPVIKEWESRGHKYEELLELVKRK